MAVSADQWRAAGASFDFQGQRVFYLAQGEGPVVLCLHGFPVSSWDWHRMWPDLTGRFRVVAPDLLGYGFSAKPTAHSYSTFEQADLVEALLRDLGVPHCHLLAHDYGDTVAQELIARTMDGSSKLRFDSVCLLNGGLFPETHHARPVQRLLLSPLGPLLARCYTRAAMERSMRALFGARTPPDASELDAQWQIITSGGGLRVMHRLIGYVRERRRHRERWVGALARTEVPLRLIVGTDDPVSGSHMARRYRELVPAPDIVLLDGIGHWPQLEAAAAVLAEWQQFVGRPAEDRRPSDASREPRPTP